MPTSADWSRTPSTTSRSQSRSSCGPSLATRPVDTFVRACGQLSWNLLQPRL
jgi:hypothetical protein